MVTTPNQTRATNWTWSGARFTRENSKSKQLTAPTFLQVHKRARYYDPTTGEFISRDPLEYVDGMSQHRGYFVPGGMDPTGEACTNTGHIKGPLTVEVGPLGGWVLPTNPSNIGGSIERFAHCNCKRKYTFLYSCQRTVCSWYFGGYTETTLETEVVVAEFETKADGRKPGRAGYWYDQVSVAVTIFNFIGGGGSWGEIVRQPDRTWAEVDCKAQCKKDEADGKIPVPTAPARS